MFSVRISSKNEIFGLLKTEQNVQQNARLVAGLINVDHACSIQSRNQGLRIVLYFDGVGSHATRKVNQWLDERRFKCVNKEEWLSNSFRLDFDGLQAKRNI